MDKQERIKELVKILNDASLAYYGGREEVISNFEWDMLFDELSKLEIETGFILEDSPTQRVSSELGTSNENNKDRVLHEYPALSLAKTKSVDDLINWAGERKVNLSYKLDGLTLVITYDNGKLTRILTRGNGIEGKDITHLKDVIGGFPLGIKYNGHMVVRGEAVISYTDFNIINSLSDDEGYANPRNLASGTLALDDPLKVKERRVTFNAFTLVHKDESISSFDDSMKYLKEEGFNIVEYVPCVSSTIIDNIRLLTSKVEDGSMDIPVDGLVLVYDDIEYSKGGSVTGHHATRAGLAFKWEDESKTTELKYIEWSCAASTISPVAVFEPVLLEGTTVSRASLCNISEIERLGVKDKCTIEVIKANKIIPKVIAVKLSEGNLTIPSFCPVCEHPTVVNISDSSGTKTLHCTNNECTAKKSKKFERLVSKSGLDIDGMSIQTIIKFINEKYIKEYADVFHLDRYAGEILSHEGFGAKSYQNLINAVEKAREVKAVNFIYSLSIPMIGLDAAKKIIASLGIEGFNDYLDKGIGFDEIDGIGPEKSNSILNWYKVSTNQEEYQNLYKELTIKDGEAKSGDGDLKGITFVITGDVHIFKNRDEFKNYVEANGGKVAGSVSGKTAFLVNNDSESNSSKNKKAKDLGIPIITEDEFVDRFGK